MADVKGSRRGVSQQRAVRTRHLIVVMRIGLSLAAALVAIAIGGPLLATTLAPDHDAPPDVARVLPEAKRHLAGQLDEFTAVVRYVGWEHRDRDDLVILMFELRSFPYVTVDRAYLVSRCTPMAELDPVAMGGGRGVRDFRTDAELEYLRSDAQPACES